MRKLLKPMVLFFCVVTTKIDYRGGSLNLFDLSVNDSIKDFTKRIKKNDWDIKMYNTK